MVEVGGKLVEQFAANLAQLLAGDTGPAGPAESSGSGTDAGGGAVPAASGTSVDGVSAPAGTADAPSGNGSSAAARPMASTAAPAQEDSLNLVKVVGPVLLKRLVPVVVAAAGLALLSRLAWRLRHRPQRAEEA